MSLWSTLIKLNYVVQTAINPFHLSCVQLDVPESLFAIKDSNNCIETGWTLAVTLQPTALKNRKTSHLQIFLYKTSHSLSAGFASSLFPVYVVLPLEYLKRIDSEQRYVYYVWMGIQNRSPRTVTGLSSSDSWVQPPFNNILNELLFGVRIWGSLRAILWLVASVILQTMPPIFHLLLLLKNSGQSNRKRNYMER